MAPMFIRKLTLPTHFLGAVAFSVVTFTAMAPKPAQASTTTVEIVTNTIAAYPSCLGYELKGACFWLWCTLYYCEIRTSIRIAHYVPDAVVSTYNDPTMHPWTEIGKPLSTALSQVGSALMASPIDSSAGTQRESTEIATFKSADAIANPAGMIASMIASGSVADFSGGFGFPGFQELQKFPQTVGSIASSWTQVPAQIGSDLMQSFRDMIAKPMEIYNKITSTVEMVGNLQSGLGNLGELFGGDSTSMGLNLGTQALSMAGIDVGPLKSLISAVSGYSGDGNQFLCPGAASAFTLHFSSDMDALFWRGVVPLEYLYPQSWVPGLAEVTKGSGLNSTWGSTYPRMGEIVQSHPVKSSAVIAERVGSIIKQEAQPHIYKYLEPGSGFRYFGDRPTKWQMLSPVPETTCQTFGENDSLSLSSFGDGKTDTADGYVWNMWNKYDCCRVRGAFLFSVP